jgi:ribosomal protein S6
VTKYQLLFIIENGLSDEVKLQTVDKFTDLIKSLGGAVSAVDKWGTRQFAYPIDFKREGYYVLVNFEAGPEAPAEIERQMRNSDAIVRQMITKV